MCVTRESLLRESCEKEAKEKLGNCIVHGPAASRPSLVLDEKNTSPEQAKGIQLLSYKLAAMYWSIQQDMQFIDNHIGTSEYVMAEQRLKLMLYNNQMLFNIQQQLAHLIEGSGNTAQVAQSWRNFADETDQLTLQFFTSSTALLNNEKTQEKATKLAQQMLSATGDLYEQVAYAYTQARQHELAANTWKQSASISSTLLSIAENNNDKEVIDYYRYQSATRLHRASATLKELTTTKEM
ncbi:hypothetical protein SAMN02745866_00390 [Alteromonadaceae bacterium Bs31]|nr:hypothetical protein SAMN02745866_00390 [Alteromonadaceae bacterium Bs31]